MKKRKLTIGQKIRMKMPLKVKSIDKENFILTMVASTQDTDRQGDIVIQSGWQLEQFNENPVILNSHRYNDATEVIANAIRTEIKGKGKKSRLEQDWKFAVNENPKAKIIFDLYAGGFLHASSVGFIPRKFKQDKDGTTDWFTIEEAELLEVSAVSVPANAYALAKSKGIDLDILKSQKYEQKDNDGDGADDDDEDDEIPEDNEDEDDDGQEPAPEGDDSEEGEEDDNDEGEGDDGDEPDKEDAVKEEEPEIKEPEPAAEPEPKKESYASKVVKALNSIEDKKKASLDRVAKILNSLSGAEHAKLDEETKLKIRKRKINQSIRELMKSK